VYAIPIPYEQSLSLPGVTLLRIYVLDGHLERSSNRRHPENRGNEIAF
jgi:hypothetical protein